MHVVRGARLASERHGHGTPLIWGHGLTSSRELDGEIVPIDWGRVGVHAEVIRYDARGHGLSDTTDDLGDYGWDRLALDQLGLADALGVDRYIAAGASMGAGTAVHAAVAAPGRIRGLVLVIPPTGWETRAAQRELYLARADVVESGDLEAVIDAARTIPPPDPFGNEWHDRFATNLRAAERGRTAHVLRGAARADLPSPDAIAGIAVPTVILAWSGDPGHPVSTAERLADLIAGSRLVVARTRADLERWTDEVIDLIGRSRA
jgi:pimeloyl-ACP methyl ester carboxylesterase